VGKTILITGGARSGKSRYAEKLAGECKGKVLYIATSIPFDDEMKSRIKIHKESRPAKWDTYEGYRDIGDVVLSIGDGYDVILIDCITVMVTNLLLDYPGIDYDNSCYDDFAPAEKEIKNEMDKLMAAIRETKASVIMVTNELGSGIVPENVLSRVFRDIAGRTNQYIGSQCDEVFMTVCGLPIKLK